MSNPPDTSSKIAWLEEQLTKANQIILKQQKEIQNLQKINKKLQGQLSKVFNEFTPSGSVAPYLKDELKSAFPPENAQNEKAEHEEKSASLNKRNKRPKPDRKKKHGIKRCPKCNKKLRPLKKTLKRIVIHLELPKAETVEHISGCGYCPDCKERFYAPIPDTLPNSKYSLDIAIFIVTLFIVYNMTQRKISELLCQFGVQISPASINNVYHNVRNYLGEKKYREFESQLKRSLVTHADETSHRDKGKNGFIWLVANAKTVFIRIEKSRSSKIAKKLPLGKYTNCDGYRAYDKAAKLIQRCWAKISRKARNPKYYFNDEAEIEQYKTFVSALFKIFHAAKHTKERGIIKKNTFDKRLKNLLMKPRKEEPNLLRLMNYILQYEGEWFTFLLHKGISPTNNLAERMLRPIVIKRKISQHTWGEHGKRSLEVFYSLAQTCRLRNEDFGQMLRNEITHNLHDMGKS